MMRMRVSTAFVSMALVLITLTACEPEAEHSASSPSPSSAPSGAPSPSPTEPVIRPASVVVDGDSVSVKGSDGNVMIDIPFTTEATVAVAQIDQALGLAGIVTTLPASGSCFAERQRSTWGGLMFTWGPDWQRPPSAQFLAEVDGPESVNGVTVTIPSGHGVGSNEADVVAANAAAPYVDQGFGSVLHYDVAGGIVGANDYESYGGSAWFEAGKLKSFVSPLQYYYDC